MLELDIIVPENYVLPLENHLLYVPGSPTANVYVSGKSIWRFFSHDNQPSSLPTGDVAGPYFWQGLDVTLTADYLIYKTVAPAEGALIGFSSMIYNIIYLRQGHGGRGFDQNKLLQLLEHANIGKICSSIFLFSKKLLATD